MGIIELHDVHKKFGVHYVLKGINLEIKPNQTTVIIGGSGEGKTVLLKHIIGLLKPDFGSILVEGEDITKMDGEELNRIRKKFGMLFQYAALFDSLTVKENVGFVLYEEGRLSEEEINQIVKEKLALVHLEGIEEMYPSELSGGMRKRVGLARALAHQPKIILYDEPTAGLDPINANIIIELINELKIKLKMTSVVVTHDMHCTFKIADEIAFLCDGKIVESGTPEEIKKSSNQLLQQFIKGGELL